MDEANSDSDDEMNIILKHDKKIAELKEELAFLEV
jgi:hypothetical protein